MELLNIFRGLFRKHQTLQRPLHSPTNYLIGALKHIALNNPEGQRGKAIDKALLDGGFIKNVIWRK